MCPTIAPFRQSRSAKIAFWLNAPCVAVRTGLVLGSRRWLKPRAMLMKNSCRFLKFLKCLSSRTTPPCFASPAAPAPAPRRHLTARPIPNNATTATNILRRNLFLSNIVILSGSGEVHVDSLPKTLKTVGMCINYRYKPAQPLRALLLISGILCPLSRPPQ